MQDKMFVFFWFDLTRGVGKKVEQKLIWKPRLQILLITSVQNAGRCKGLNMLVVGMERQVGL